MVSFFKNLDLLRIIFLLIILLLLRLVFIIIGVPTIIPELQWLVVGEKLSRGYIMYRDVWEVMEPFSAGTYSFIVSIFGRSFLALKVISILLVFLQAMFFNLLVNGLNFYNERSSFPGLFYILFSCLFFDFYTLPPVLLGMTFLLPSLYFVVNQIRYKISEEPILYTGILTGVATMFYLPISVFLLIYILAFLLFGTASLRYYFLLFCGFFLPVLSVILYYFFHNAADELSFSLFYSFLTIPASRFTEIKLLGIICITPAILIFLGLAAVSNRSSYVNFQYSIFKVMILWLLAGVATLFITVKFAPYQLYILVPGIAYMGTHFFLLSRKKFILNFILLGFIIAVPALNAGILFGTLTDKKTEILNQLVVRDIDKNLSKIIDGKRILVIGSNLSLYKNSKLAGPYLNWEISKNHLLNLNNLEVLAYINQNFRSDLPEVIIDETDEKVVVPTIFYRIPPLESEYRKLENQNIYILKNPQVKTDSGE